MKKKLSKMAPPSADEMDMGYEEDFGISEDQMEEGEEMAEDMDEEIAEESPEIDQEEAEKHLAKLEEMGLDVESIREQFASDDSDMGYESEDEEEEDDYSFMG